MDARTARSSPANGCGWCASRTSRAYKRIILREGAVARPHQHRSAGHRRVLRHPEGIDVADRIVRPACLYRHHVVIDRDGSGQRASVPERHAVRCVDIDHPAAPQRNLGPRLRLDPPARQGFARASRRRRDHNRGEQQRAHRHKLPPSISGASSTRLAVAASPHCAASLVDTSASSSTGFSTAGGRMRRVPFV
ncbi:hypothetical protein WR25_07702 [Diploscapter pachys]|uniref:Uncharacterized protein n=1 Tax=Diploscapter pachys TaxID=2018661 RepID=A0A2A2K8D9_9BILA|nr:hypothetical protein WR25_07702 [Diploscapter pachys]